MKPRITDICHIDGSMLDAVLQPPAVRKFIEEPCRDIIAAVTHFITVYSLDRGIGGDKVILEKVAIDWPRGQIETTVSLDLKLKFELVNNRLRIIEIGFND